MPPNNGNDQIETADEILENRRVLISDLRMVSENDQTLAFHENAPYTGLAYLFFENGKEQVKQTYLEGTKEGEWYMYYDDGTPQKEGFMKEGKLHGTYREYYKNGNLRYEYNYDLDRKNGVWKTWYEDGTTQSIEYYMNDTLSGKSQIFDEEGILIKETIYEKGEAKVIEATDK